MTCVKYVLYFSLFLTSSFLVYVFLIQRELLFVFRNVQFVWIILRTPFLASYSNSVFDNDGNNVIMKLALKSYGDFTFSTVLLFHSLIKNFFYWRRPVEPLLSVDVNNL
jgi:hypothetical protein